MNLYKGLRNSKMAVLYREAGWGGLAILFSSVEKKAQGAVLQSNNFIIKFCSAVNHSTPPPPPQSAVGQHVEKWIPLCGV
jgi:hypothetical protein